MIITEIKVIEIETIRLAGLSVETNMAENKTRELWMDFRKIQKRFQNPTEHPSYSVTEYPIDFNPSGFNNQTKFKKWAATRIQTNDPLPENLRELLIPAGLYATFTYKGTAPAYAGTAAKIYREWLPASGYALDNRPHFEIMDTDYLGPMNPDSEEEIFIPVKK